LHNIIGIGKAGCAIADKFGEYSQYNVLKIDSDNIKEKNYFKITKQKTMEDYENNVPSLKKFFKPIKDEVLIVVGGSGKISGITVRILEQLKHRDTSVLYIRPDISLLSDDKTKQDRVAFYVLQEFARSAMIKRMYVVSNENLEEILGDVPIVGYYNKLNDLLVSTVHMINIFENSSAVIDTHAETILDVARISTFGILSEKNKEKWFYSLDFAREKAYYYAINKKKLEEDGQLHKKIISQVRNFKTKQTKITYGVYETEYEQDFIYCKAHVSKIQD